MPITSHLSFNQLSGTSITKQRNINRPNLRGSLIHNSHSLIKHFRVRPPKHNSSPIPSQFNHITRQTTHRSSTHRHVRPSHIHRPLHNKQRNNHFDIPKRQLNTYNKRPSANYGRHHHHPPNPPQPQLTHILNIRRVPSHRPRRRRRPHSRPIPTYNRRRQVIIQRRRRRSQRHRVIIINKPRLNSLTMFQVQHTPNLRITSRSPLIQRSSRRRINNRSHHHRHTRIRRNNPTNRSLIVNPSRHRRSRRRSRRRRHQPLYRPQLTRPIVSRPPRHRQHNQSRSHNPKIGHRLNQISRRRFHPHPVNRNRRHNPQRPNQVTFPFRPNRVLKRNNKNRRMLTSIVGTPTISLPFLTVHTQQRIQNLLRPRIRHSRVRQQTSPHSYNRRVRPTRTHQRPFPRSQIRRLPQCIRCPYNTVDDNA